MFRSAVPVLLTLRSSCLQRRLARPCGCPGTCCFACSGVLNETIAKSRGGFVPAMDVIALLMEFNDRARGMKEDPRSTMDRTATPGGSVALPGRGSRHAVMPGIGSSPKPGATYMSASEVDESGRPQSDSYTVEEAVQMPIQLSTDLPRMLVQSEREYMQMTGASSCRILLANVCGTLAHWTQDGQVVEFAASGPGIARKVIDTRRLVRVATDVVAHADYSAEIDLADVASTIVAPLLVGADVLAVVCLGRDASQPPFTHKEEMVVRRLSAVLSHVVHVALRTAEAEEQLSRSDELIRYGATLTNDLSGRDVTHSMLRQAVKLIRADRCSVFVLDRELEELVEYAFDVTSDESGNDGGIESDEDDGTRRSSGSPRDRFRLPVGPTSIAGWVAHTGDALNIADAYEDHRFNQAIDQQTGYRTRSILSVPMMGADGVLGVVQLVNKANGVPFTNVDEKYLRRYASFVANSIRHAQHIKALQDSHRQSECLVSLARSVFSERDLDRLARRMSIAMAGLIGTERCSLFLLDREAKELYSLVFDAGPDDESRATSPIDQIQLVSPTRRPTANARFPMDRGIAGHVAMTGETLVVHDAYADERFNRSMDEKTGFRTRNILALPIRDEDGTVVGVAQLLNKAGGEPFTGDDVRAVDGFGALCGLALKSADLLSEASHARAQLQVALDVLSYHRVDRDVCVDTSNGILATVHKRFPDMTSFDFPTHQVADDDAVALVRVMFDRTGFAQELQVKPETVLRFVSTVRQNYRNVPFHNFNHGFSVVHACYTLLSNCTLNEYFPRAELLAMFVATLCHDVDHRGTNNAFQMTAATPLHDLYGSTSVLEHHHYSQTMMILLSPGCNIFDALEDKEYKRVTNVMREAILATDLSNFFGNAKRFKALVEEGKLNTRDEEHRKLLLSVVMNACDLSHATKPWAQHHAVSLRLYDEFLAQGDVEKAKGMKPMAMMDRDNFHTLPTQQQGFINFVCQPCYGTLKAFDASFAPLWDATQINLNEWKKIETEQKAVEAAKAAAGKKTADDGVDDASSVGTASEDSDSAGRGSASPAAKGVPKLSL